MGVVEFSQQRSSKILFFLSIALTLIFLGVAFILSMGGGEVQATNITLTAPHMTRMGSTYTLEVFSPTVEIRTHTTSASGANAATDPITFRVTRGIGLVQFRGEEDGQLEIPSGAPALLELLRDDNGMFHYTRMTDPLDRIEIEVTCGPRVFRTIRVMIRLVEDDIRFGYTLENNAGGLFFLPVQDQYICIVNARISNYRMRFTLTVGGVLYFDSSRALDIPRVSFQTVDTEFFTGITFTNAQINGLNFASVPEPLRFRATLNFLGEPRSFYFTLRFTEPV